MDVAEQLPPLLLRNAGRGRDALLELALQRARVLVPLWGKTLGLAASNCMPLLACMYATCLQASTDLDAVVVVFEAVPVVLLLEPPLCVVALSGNKGVS